VDTVWHGLLAPGTEPTTVSAMRRHLATVHLPLYVGAASVLVTTTLALLRGVRRSAIGIAIPAAVGVGFLVVLIVMSRSGRAR
jgi:amino acid transporter